MRRIGAVVLAYGDEPLLAEGVAALLAGGCSRVAIVDNGFTADPAVGEDPRITWVRPGYNTGFTGGANLGAAALVDDCDVIVFANSDLVVDVDAPQVLTDALADDSVGLVCGLVVLHDDPAVINSAGNPVHYSLMSWSGGWGEAAESVTEPRIVASASGALMAVRTRDWMTLGGLNPELFAYGEDVDLSLRVWQSGRSVLCVPAAVGRHDYAFTGNPHKSYLLERNRLFNIATLLETTTIRAFAPGLLLLEVAILAAATVGGWLPEKAAGYAWLWRNRDLVRSRRTWVQQRRRVPDEAVLPLLSDTITPAAGTGVRVPEVFNRLLSTYGGRARRRLRRLGAGDGYDRMTQ